MADPSGNDPKSRPLAESSAGAAPGSEPPASPRADVWRDVVLACVLIAAVVFGLPWADWRDALGPGAPESASLKDRDADASAGANDEPAENALPAPPVERAPEFDVVRATGEETTLVAGRAAANAEVRVVVDGITRGRGRADADGNFVIFAAVQPGDEPQVMWLMAASGGDMPLTSAESVVIAPGRTEDAGEDPPVAGAGGHEVASAQPPEADRGADTAATDADPEPRSETEAAQAVILEDDGAAQLMAPPPLADETAVQIDTLSYGAEGAVILSGRAQPGFGLSVTLDGEELAAPDVAQEGPRAGEWEAALSDVAPGRYRLSVTATGPDGSSAGSVEIPFSRERPDAVSEALDDAGAKAVTVQPGMTLWAIARDAYGDGTRYVTVFGANRGRIEDPDLIYPGQIFDLPAPGDTAAPAAVD